MADAVRRGPLTGVGLGLAGVATGNGAARVVAGSRFVAGFKTWGGSWPWKSAALQLPFHFGSIRVKSGSAAIMGL